MVSRHSEFILNQLQRYDDFLDSLKTVADMGCGVGIDTHWWATLTNRDENPEPYNYTVYAVDKDGVKLSSVPNLSNIIKIERDFTEGKVLPKNVDLMWAHDCLQYSTNPIDTLKIWNSQMNVNAMLCLAVQQHSGISYNRYYSRSFNYCYFHYTPTMLIYMLAVNGFDCRDAYLYKAFGDPWINVAVYKSDVAPMDPAKTSWYDLIDAGLLHPTIERSITSNGHLRQEEILYPWLDRENYFIDYIPERTNVFQDADTEPSTEGVINLSVESTKQQLIQPESKTVSTPIQKPIGIMRPPKGKNYKP